MSGLMWHISSFSLVAYIAPSAPRVKTTIFGPFSKSALRTIAQSPSVSIFKFVRMVA